jgi:hypothetical protein
VINGLNDVAKIYKYNLRANNSVTAGKMTLAGSNIVITGNHTFCPFCLLGCKSGETDTRFIGLALGA